MPDINCFISYARTDEDFASELTNDLQNLGIETWRDKENIPAGASWDGEIESAILNCIHLILVATPDAVSSENVRDEIGLAIDKGKIIIPILLMDCELPMRIRRTQWLDFRGDYTNGLKQLCAELGIDYIAPEVYKPFLDLLFADVLDRMARLSNNRNGEFTSQEFLKDAVRVQSLVYIDFLAFVKEYFVKTRGTEYAQKWVFNLVHQSIGGRLSREARQAGYEQIKGKRDEMDIFGNPSNRVTYRRPE